MNTTINKLNSWNNRLSDAFSCIGSDCFADKLVGSLSTLIDFDVCMVFAYGEEHGSICLHHNMVGDQAKLLVDDYLTGPHLLDPFYAAATSGQVSGFGSMKELAPDHFYKSEFYQHHYVRTGIEDEIGIFFPVDSGRIAVLSVTRQNPRDAFSEEDNALFASAASVVEKFGTRHWGADTATKETRLSSTTIKEVFESFGDGILTQREKEIIALVLKGHSSLSIGHVLSIAEGTVKIHRKNAYGKLGIVSQADLFSKFLSLLEQRLHD